MRAEGEGCASGEESRPWLDDLKWKLYLGFCCLSQPLLMMSELLYPTAYEAAGFTGTQILFDTSSSSFLKSSRFMGSLCMS